MGFFIFLAIILYILFKTWKQVVKFILIGIILMFGADNSANPPPYFSKQGNKTIQKQDLCQLL